MKKQILSIYELLVTKSYLFAGIILARGGGGGSGGGGGGGGGGGFGGGHSGGSGGNADPFTLLMMLIVFVVVIIISYFINKFNRKAELQRQADILKTENLDWTPFKKRVEELFNQFEKAWAEFDLATLEKILTPEYYKRIVLELNVLQNEHRSDLMSDMHIYDITLTGKELDEERETELVVKITASANDSLMDTADGKQLFYDGSTFTEYWHLEKHDGVWLLDLITQSTEDSAMTEPAIAAFAMANGFYFDPDFGWLMMPNKGVLFSKTNFGTSDINNHVIGYFRNKIVEFYTYIPNPNSRMPENYVIAQAILPKTYHDILIKKKHWLEWPKSGLRKTELESADFNSRFNVWADPADQVNSLELLTPNFMEKIYNLPFELNIELVGNFLYFYTKDRSQANYDKMLEILSWAFDEMKM